MIKVGMLVEIIDAPDFKNMGMRSYIGHIGKVKGYGWCGAPHWEIEGAEFYSDGISCAFHPKHLRPINPPRENKDITETLDNPVSWDDVPGWNPTKEVCHD